MLGYPRRCGVAVRSCSLVVVVGLLIGFPSTGAAQEEEEKTEVEKSAEEMTEAERQKYQQLLKSGKSEYASKNFEKAFEQLKAAHDIHPKPSILFNLALISEKQGKLERASEYYGKFIEAPDVSLKARKRASERMAAVNDILSKSGDEGEAPAQTTDLMPALEAMNTEVDEGVTGSPDSGEEQAEETTGGEESAEGEEGTAGADQSTVPSGTGAGPGTQTAEEPPQVDYDWPVYASFGAGTAALTAGVVTLAMTNDRIDKAKAAGRSVEDRDQHVKYEDEASTYASVTAGLFAGGTVLVGLGSFFVIQQSSAVERQPRADEGSKPDVSVSVGEEYTGAQLSIDF